MNTFYTPPGGATGSVRLILRLEAAALLIAALTAYAALHGGWTRFAMLFLVPDLGMLAYLAGRSVGAAGYNLTHSYALPAGLALIGDAQGVPDCLPLAAIWVAHIAFDRMLGYGLKYPSGFGDTHLGSLGRRMQTIAER